MNLTRTNNATLALAWNRLTSPSKARTEEQSRIAIQTAKVIYTHLLQHAKPHHSTIDNRIVYITAK